MPTRRRAELVRPTVSLAHGVAAALGTHDARHDLLLCWSATRSGWVSEKKCLEGKQEKASHEVPDE